MHEPRSRRSELATPASSERMCEKAATSGADLVFLDLEDACAPIAKESARATAVAALTDLDWGSTVRAVRVNGLETQWCYGDIIDIVSGAGESLDVIIVPKARIGPRRLVGRCPADPAGDEARPEGGASASRSSSRRPRASPTRPRSPRPATGSRRSSSAPATSRRRCTPGSTATSIPVERLPGRLLALRPRADARRGARRRHRRHRRPLPRLPGPGRATGARRRTPACSASTASGPSIPTRSPSPTRCSPPPTPRSPTPRRPSRPTAASEADGVGAIGRDGRSSTPPTCASPRTCCTSLARQRRPP